MIEVYGNLWDFPGIKCITTNGTINRFGEAVMGRGCALEAKKKYPLLAKELAESIRQDGNNVHVFSKYPLITFPVKHHWSDKADIELIKRSAIQLLGFSIMSDNPNEDIYLPRPGCGNGHLQWEDVKLVIKPILISDQFKIVTFA